MAVSREAIAGALKWIQELYPQARAARLEELVEVHSGQWDVTVSFLLEEDPDEPRPQSTFLESGGPRYRRFYKTVVVDDAGVAHSMRMRGVGVES